MIHTAIPQDELELFASLEDINIVFDVGARADAEYIKLKPNIELHAFEPNPVFFNQLTTAIGERENTKLNMYGLGDVETEEAYDGWRQGFANGEESSIKEGILLPIKTLDWYVEKNQVQKIDFLKIDTEGYDYKVLIGGKQTIPKCHYIQYEYWNNKLQFHDLLERDFEMRYIGNRNVFCINKLWS